MTKYQVAFQNVAMVYITVEANDPEEAIDLAYEQIPYDVCAQCSGWGQDYTLDIGDSWDVDGEPAVIS